MTQRTSIAIVAVSCCLAWGCSSDQTSVRIDSPRISAPSSQDSAEVAEHYYDLGRDLGRKREYEDAVQALSKAIEVDPDHAMAYYYRALYSYYGGRYNRAIKDLNEVIKIKPESDWAYCLRSNAYLRRGSYGMAMRDADEAVRLNPESVGGWVTLGGVCFKQGKYPRAVNAVTKAVAIDPTSRMALLNRASMYYNLGQHGPARADVRRARSLGHEVPEELLAILR